MNILRRIQVRWMIYKWAYIYHLNWTIFHIFHSRFAYWIETDKMSEYIKNPVDIDGYMFLIWTRWTHQPILLLAVFDDKTFQIKRDDFWYDQNLYGFLFQHLSLFFENRGYTFEVRP